MNPYLLCFSALAAFFALNTAQAGGRITTAHDVANDLSTSRAGERTFEFTATVSLSEQISTNVWVLGLDDETGHVVTDASNLQNSYIPSPGDTIRCLGYVKQRKNLKRQAVVTHAEFISHEPPPIPAPINPSELLTGKHDYQLVRLTGTAYDVQVSETNPHWFHLTLADNTNLTYVSLFAPSSDQSVCDDLIGADLSIDGICFPMETGIRRHLGRTFNAFRMSSIKVINPAPKTPEDTPDILDLTNIQADKLPFFRRHHASGVVIAAWNGQALLRTTNSTIVKVSFLTQRIPVFGQCIDAIGFPETNLFHLNLARATWNECKRSGSSSMSAEIPSPIQNNQETFQFNTSQHGSLIRIQGHVLTLPSRDTNTDLIYVKTKNNVIPVYVIPSWHELSDLRIDCKVEITGTCVLDAELWHPHLVYPRARGYLLVTRVPSDIKIMAFPPWWSIKKLLSSLCVTLLVLIGLAIWNTSLRRLATRKSRELFKEQLGHVKADLRTEERTRLAVELHDTLAQNLTGVSMEIEAANDLRGDAPKAMLDHLGIAAKALKSCRDELRNCLWDLRSQALEEQDMSKAVLKTLQPIVNDSRLAVRFNVPRTRLSDNTAHALLRVVRELVINAIRHGNAKAVKVAGTIDNGKLLCSVTDNGCGFDPETAPGVLQGHFGLQGIQERIDEIGGAFEIASAPGKGTKATISIPIPHES